MKKLKKLLLFVFVCQAIFVTGQPNKPITEEPPYIEVTGTAEKEVVPDEIYIGIVIREKYVNKVKVTIEEQETALINALKSIGISTENLSLSDINADYVSIRWQKKDVLTKKDYTLKVTDAQTVGKVFQELDNLDITDAFVKRVSHSKLDSLRKEVRIMAIQAAKDKAGYLLTAIGERLGKPLIIHETDTFPGGTAAGVNIRGSRSEETAYYIDGIKAKNSNDSEIQFQKIKLQSGIYVKFLIQ